MSKIGRVFKIFKSILMLTLGALILLLPSSRSYVVACTLIGVVITINGLKDLIFYISSARHMVGGGRIFINSVIMMDLGLISFMILYESPVIAMLYLVSIFVVMGAIDIARSIETKKNEYKFWFVGLIKGILAILVGVACFILADSIDIMLLVFGIGLIVIAVEGIAMSFTKSAIEYIPEG